MCFHENEQLALHILESKSELFFNKSPLDIAKQMNSQTFLSTQAARHYYDQQWYGNLKDNRYNRHAVGFLVCFM